jgi:C-terminal processing protease CtpA/Prc
VSLTGMVFVTADGQLIDGMGIRPDIIAEPEVGYYLGTSDQMLDKAIAVLKEKATQ